MGGQRSHLFQHLLSLEGQNAKEDKVTFRYNTLVVEVYPDPKLLLESPQQVRLSGGDHDFHIRYLPLDLKKLGKDHGADLPASDKSDFEHRISSFGILQIYMHLVGPAGFRHINVKLSAFLSVGASPKGSKHFTIDACQVDTLKHDDISDDLTCQESVLQLFIRDEVFEPALSKLWDAVH